MGLLDKKLVDNMDKIKKLVGGIIAIGTLLGIIFTAYMQIDSRYALAKDHKKLEKKLSVFELKLLLKDALENLYFYKKQVRKYPGDEELKTKKDDSQDEVDFIKKQIRELRKKKTTNN